MAIIYGYTSNKTIKHLAEYLKYSLDDSFEIFMEPKINGDHIHLLILRKNAGFYLLQVKSYALENYDINQVWTDKTTNRTYQSPIQQLINYKNNFFMYHLPSSYEKLVENPKIYGWIKGGLYFEKVTTSKAIASMKNDKHYTKYIDILGFNCIDRGQIAHVLLKKLAYPKEPLIEGEAFYHYIKDYLLNKRKSAYLPKMLEDKKSLSIIQSQKTKLKIRSTSPVDLYATLINKVMTTPTNVLVLTYSMTLTSYLRSYLPAQENSNVLVIHVHQFLASIQNNFNLLSPIDTPTFFHDLTRYSKYIHKYDTIIFTESMEYDVSLQKNIANHFLKENGCLYYFSHDTSGEKIKTILPGRWTQMEEEKKDSSEYLIESTNKKVIDIMEINNFLLRNNATWEDSVILASKKSYLRFINEELKTNLGIYAECSFATTKEWDYLRNKYGKQSFGLEILKLERNKKFHFGTVQDQVQLNTIKSHHSYYKRVAIIILCEPKEEILIEELSNNHHLFIIRLY